MREGCRDAVAQEVCVPRAAEGSAHARAADAEGACADGSQRQAFAEPRRHEEKASAPAETLKGRLRKLVVACCVSIRRICSGAPEVPRVQKRQGCTTRTLPPRPQTRRPANVPDGRLRPPAMREKGHRHHASSRSPPRRQQTVQAATHGQVKRRWQAVGWWRKAAFVFMALGETAQPNAQQTHTCPRSRAHHQRPLAPPASRPRKRAQYIRSCSVMSPRRQEEMWQKRAIEIERA